MSIIDHTLNKYYMLFPRLWEPSPSLPNCFINNNILTVKPGVRYREMGDIIQKHAQANGFSVVRSYCGHGIHR